MAIITGGGTGMGRAMALEFAKAGAGIVVASRAKLESARDERAGVRERTLYRLWSHEIEMHLAHRRDAPRVDEFSHLVQELVERAVLRILHRVA